MQYTATAVVLTFLTFTVLITFSHCAPKQNCIKNTNSCVRSAECCTGCCHDEKCVEFNDSCLGDKLSGAVGPCALLDPPCAARGHTCVLGTVSCIQSPCDPVASCVPPDYADYY